MEALSTPAKKTRKANTEARYQRIREQFKRDYTDAPVNPRKYTREYVISQIAQRWCISMGTVENIIYSLSLEPAAPQAQALAQAA